MQPLASICRVSRANDHALNLGDLVLDRIAFGIAS